MKEKLYKYLLRKNLKSFNLKDLKQDFSPIELASQLIILENQEMITIDWHRKKIWVNLTYQGVYLRKNELNKYKREIPEYMKAETLNINEPYLG